MAMSRKHGPRYHGRESTLKLLTAGCAARSMAEPDSGDDTEVDLTKSGPRHWPRSDPAVTGHSRRIASWAIESVSSLKINFQCAFLSVVS